MNRWTVAVSGLALVATLGACGGSPSTVGSGPATSAPTTSAPSTPPDASPETSSPPASAPASEPAGPVVPTPITVQGNEVQYHGEQTVSEQASTDMEVNDFFFSPTVLVGTAGQTLTINLNNVGKVQHTFTVKDQVDVVLDGGAKMSVEVTFPKSGVLDYVCRFHIGSGMAGQLAVADS